MSERIFGKGGAPARISARMDDWKTLVFVRRRSLLVHATALYRVHIELRRIIAFECSSFNAFPAAIAQKAYLCWAHKCAWPGV